MVPFAITLSDLIEKGGSYAGLAAFFGLAVLAILYFAQAREVRRLREWAGRSPERAQELEERVVQQAESARRVVAQPIRRPGEPATAAAQRVVPTAGKPPPAAEPEITPADEAPEKDDSPTEHPVVASAAPADTPAEVDAPAKAQDAEADAPEREAVPAGVAASAAGVPVASAAVPTTPSDGPSVPVAPGGNGAPAASPSTPPLVPRATQGPAIRRPAPAAAPLRTPAPAARRPTVPPRRPGPPPPLRRDEDPGRRRTGILTAAALAGVTLIVIGLIALLGSGGGDEPTPTATDPTQVETAVPANGGDGGDDPGATPEAGPGRGDTSVAVLNGTTVAGLADGLNTQLEEAGYVEAQPPNNWTDQARSASVVFYAGSEFRSQAIDIADQLQIADRQPIIAEATSLAPSADVVIVVGADQTP